MPYYNFSLNLLKTGSIGSTVNSTVTKRSMSSLILHSYIGDLHVLCPTSQLRHENRYKFHRQASGMPVKKSATYYYDVLGLSPKATQNQIKGAYYEMSKMHHPDVTECPKSHSLFTEINEAYEVLGNLKKRRMYDKGVYNLHDHRNYDVPDQDYTKVYQTRNFDKRPPPPRGHSKIYNFDEFYRQHYNDLRKQKASDMKAYMRHEEMMAKKAQKKDDSLPLNVIVAIISVMCFYIVLILDSRYDTDVRPQERAARDNK